MISTILLSLALAEAAMAADVLVPKAKFLEKFQAGAPASFCAEKGYFRKCFGFTDEACRKAVSAAVESCAKSVAAELPAQFRQPADGQKWGEKIGSCAGTKIETDAAKSKREGPDTPDCGDASKWK
jgi:hypothetical protein